MPEFMGYKRWGEYIGGQGDQAEFLNAIAHPRRIAVLNILKEQQRPLERGELAQQIVDRNGYLGRSDVERVEISLFHQHLPHLEDVGLVGVDREQRMVRLTEKGLEEYP